MSEKTYLGTGRRKSSVARVYLTKGEGNITINNKNINDYFGRKTSRMIVEQPLIAVAHANYTFNINVNVDGGGISGQSGAIRLGLTRALLSLSIDEANEETKDFREILKAKGYVTRDPRRVERKKFGKHKARKSPQFSKR
jgi:small subunit ribosomal protein S9